MTSFEDEFDQAAAEVEGEDELYALRESLRRTQAQLKKAKAKSDEIAEAAFNGARAAFLSQPRPKLKPYVSAPSGTGRPEHALWHMTDWQGSKKTASYDSGVMHDRVRTFVKRALKITEIQRANHPVKGCHILLGGDMIEGLFNFPTQPFEIDMTLFDQYVTVAKLIAETVRTAARHYDEVHIVPEWGNHGRLGSKRDAVPRSDNADRMCYRLAEEMTRDIPNVTWQPCDGDIQQLEIGNYRALLIHGDEIGRGGFASPMTIVQHVNRWRSGAWPWKFRDVYIGHYHQHQEWNMANGEGAVYMSGSLESDNRYAREGMASSALPSQRLHFIDPREGMVTAQYKIWVGDTHAAN